MRVYKTLSVLLALLLLLGLTACGGTGTPTGTLPSHSTPTAPNTANAPETEPPAPESTAAPASAYTRPQGADSVKTLLEKCLDYLHTGDYSKIADVHDRQACMAELLVIILYESSFVTETVTEITWQEALDRAAVVFEGAEALREKDPELADRIMEFTNAQDPVEMTNQYLSQLREGFQNGAISEDHPNYEKLYQILVDADKGPEYVYETYPEIFDGIRQQGVIFGLEGALEKLMQKLTYSDEQTQNDFSHFRTLECEYGPENSYEGKNGSVYDYVMGSVVADRSTWSISMMYYVEDAVYYLVGFDWSVGGVGG